jgi:hypothetical protein
VDLSHGYATHPTSDQTCLRNFPELYKYTFPEHRITSRGAESFSAMNYVFATGFLLESFLQLRPPESDYLVRLVKLRLQLSRFFAEGTFIDTDGLYIEPDGLVAKAFTAKSGGEKAIVIFNPNGHPSRAKLKVERQSENWQIMSPRTSEVAERQTQPGQPLEFELQSDELKIIIVC